MANTVTPKSDPAPMLISAHKRLCEVPRVAPSTPPPTASANAKITNPNESSFMQSIATHTIHDPAFFQDRMQISCRFRRI